jgi:hypothetical protein
LQEHNIYTTNFVAFRNIFWVYFGIACRESLAIVHRPPPLPKYRPGLQQNRILKNIYK